MATKILSNNHKWTRISKGWDFDLTISMMRNFNYGLQASDIVTQAIRDVGIFFKNDDFNVTQGELDRLEEIRQTY